MGFEIIDGYLLGQPVSKTDVVAALLAYPTDDPAAAPFHRALEAVGVRAADEAFVALRLVLAGKAPHDAAVRRLRALAGVARACARGDAALLAATLKRDRGAISDIAGSADAGDGDRAALGAAAEGAYYQELGWQKERHP